MTTRSLDDVSKKLRALAPSPNHPLNRLASQLVGDDKVYFSGTSLAAMYPPEVMLPAGKAWLAGLTNLLELIRDVLIFVPVMYTWWQLAKALIAWQHYSGSDAFLLAWQEGFPQHGHSQTQPLSTSATAVAGIVLGVVCLTLVAQAFRSAYDRQVQNRQRRLAGLLAEASLAVNQLLVGAAPDVTKQELAEIGLRISTTAQDLSTALGKSSGAIVGAVNANPGSELHKMFGQWTTMADKWVTAADKLGAMSEKLKGADGVADHLRETQKALLGMQASIQGETNRLLQALEQERVQATQEAFNRREAAAGIERSSSLLAESLEGLSERAEQFNTMVFRLEKVVNRVDSQSGGNR